MSPLTLPFTLTTLTLITPLTTATWTYEGTTITLALVNYTYEDPNRDSVETCQTGKYAPGQVNTAFGQVLTTSTDTRDCEYPWSSPGPVPESPWVALVGKGRCTDDVKVRIAAARNASAVILFTSDQHAHLRKIDVDYPGLAVVWVGEEEGRGLVGVVRGGARVHLTLTPGHHLRYHVTTINRTSVLFVSVSFIILMAISLAWLIFYYVQRFRYIHAKDRLARHLCNAAKKALAKIPVKTLKAVDREITLDGECCAVCIEHYLVGEAIRTLPCKHQFHRFCVDPWLLEHRTCPMCKMDILKHYGYVLSESEESVLQLDDGGGGGRADPLPPPAGPLTPRSAPHLTAVTLVTRSNSGGARSGGSGVGVDGGRHDGLVGVESVSPTHPTTSPAPTNSLLSLLSPLSKNASIASSAGLQRCTPIPTLQQEGDTQEGDVCSSVCSAPRPPTPAAAQTPEAFPVPPEASADPPPPPSPPKRPKRRSTPEVTTPNTTTTTTTPASHVVCVSHF